MAKRRGQNEGTIFEERPGRWVALISLAHKIVNGKRHRIRKKFAFVRGRSVMIVPTATAKSRSRVLAHRSFLFSGLAGPTASISRARLSEPWSTKML